MINKYSIASRIPREVRQRRILNTSDPIAKAMPSSSNPDMMLLAEIWYTFIEPHKARNYCSVCLTNILENFRALKADLIELEKQYQLLLKL